MRKFNETELSVELVNNSFIKLKGADNPDTLKGVGIDGVVLDEYAFTKPYVWDEIIRPMLFDRNGWALFISTPKGYNHFYELWESANRENWARFHFTTYDNPIISKEEIEEAKRTMSAIRFQQEIMAEFARFEGAVWPDFRRDIHIIPKYNPTNEYPIYGSLDFGYATGHPTAFQLHEVRPDQVITFDGFTVLGKDIEEIASMMKQYCTGLVIRKIFADSARPDLIDTLRKSNYGSFPVYKADKDVELGVAKVAEFMKVDPISNKPRWAICDHLSEAIKQIENYEWEEVRGEDGKFKQVPRKENDDNPDALRYFFNTYNKQTGDPYKQVHQIISQRESEDFY